MCALAALTVLSASARAQTTGICDRTSQVQTAILDALTSVSDCADVTASDLRGITSLNLRNKGIAALQSGDFAGLTGLRNAYLDSNQLGALPDGVFDDLFNLWQLRLINNQLSALPDGVFDDLSRLDAPGLV